MSFSKILVPIDFTSHSAEALRVAAKLVARPGGELVLLYVQEPPDSPFLPGPLVYTPAQLERVASRARARLEAARLELDRSPELRVDVRLTQGRPAAAILGAAADGFDLIVLGTHGRRGLQRALLGSIAERVMRDAPCPTLTVKASRLEREALAVTPAESRSFARAEPVAALAPSQRRSALNDGDVGDLIRVNALGTKAGLLS